MTAPAEGADEADVGGAVDTGDAGVEFDVVGDFAAVEEMAVVSVDPADRPPVW